MVKILNTSSYHTLLRFLKKNNFFYKKLTKKPFIKAPTRKKRLDFSINTIHTLNLRNMLIFTDEKRFTLDGICYNQKRWIHSSAPASSYHFLVNKNYEKLSIMVWGFIYSRGIIYLHRCTRTLNSEEYQKILKKGFIPAANKIYPYNSFYMLQDNAPCHRSYSTEDFFIEQGLSVINLPPNSPDLNPIENIWGLLANRVYQDGRRYTKKSELWAQIESEWKKLGVEEVAKFTENWDERLSQVIQEEGRITKY